MNIMNDEDQKQTTKFICVVSGILHTQCKRMCPDNKGYEPRCEHCTVQRIFRRVRAEFEVVAENIGLFNALRCLVENEHRKPMENWEMEG